MYIGSLDCTCQTCVRKVAHGEILVSRTWHIALQGLGGALCSLALRQPGKEEGVKGERKRRKRRKRRERRRSEARGKREGEKKGTTEVLGE